MKKNPTEKVGVRVDALTFFTGLQKMVSGSFV